MSLTRKFLTGMGLTEEQVDTIIEGHRETVDSLKQERDDLKASADKLTSVEEQLKEANEKIATLESASEKLATLEKEYSDYKANIEQTELSNKKIKARDEILKEIGIPTKWIDRASEGFSLESIEFNKDGTVKDKDKLSEALKEKWSDVIGEVKTIGASVANPATNNGSKTTLTKDEIMQEKDPVKRQNLIKENIELFS